MSHRESQVHFGHIFNAHSGIFQGPVNSPIPERDTHNNC